MRLYLPPRPRSTIRNGVENSEMVISAQEKRFIGALIRKRAPAPAP